MHSTKKGNQWHFGMKVHASIDAGTGYVHTITGIAANVHDSADTTNLVKLYNTVVYGDYGYLGIEKRKEVCEDENLSKIDFRIHQRPTRLKTNKTYLGIPWECLIKRHKSLILNKIERIPLIIQHTFNYRKVAYHGLAKDMPRLHLLFACTNLLMCLRTGQKTRFCEG